MSKVLEDIYSGSAEIGNIQATITLVIGIIIALCSSSIGSYIAVIQENPEPVKAIVERDSICTQQNDQIHCVTDIKYTVNNKEYKQPVGTQNKQFKTNDTIDIQYKPSNPTDISYKTDNVLSPKLYGTLIICAGAIILSIVILYFYLIRKYKPLAALQGAKTTIDVAKGIFN